MVLDTDKIRSDYKFSRIAREGDGTMNFDLRFYEGKITTEPQEDVNGVLVNVTRYRRPPIQTVTARPQSDFDGLLARDETVDIDGHEVTILLRRHLTELELLRAMDKVLALDRTREPIDERKVIA